MSGFKPDSIIVHCSDTVDSGTVSWPAIEDYHVHVKGWLDIGYHAGVELAGTRYESLLGRPWDQTGAHCEAGGMNHRSLGVCCIGSFDVAPPPAEQLAVLARRVLIPWMRIFSIPPERIYLHRDFEMHKTCPGKAFTKDMILKAIGG